MGEVFAKVVFTGPWDALEKAFDRKRWEPHFRVEMKQANAINGLILQRTARKAIRDASTHGPPNTPLTLALKGSRNPLYESGELHDAITYRVKSWNRVEVGVFKQTRRLMSIARVVHDGMDIKVTTKMRLMFKAIHRASLDPSKPHGLKSPRARKIWRLFQKHGGGIFPKLDNQAFIRITGRPFMVWATTKYPSESEKLYQNVLAAFMRSLAIPGSSGVPRYNT
jgi:hypothetical protein